MDLLVTKYAAYMAYKTSLTRLYTSLFKAFIKAMNCIRPFCKFEFLITYRWRQHSSMRIVQPTSGVRKGEPYIFDISGANGWYIRNMGGV